MNFHSIDLVEYIADAKKRLTVIDDVETYEIFVSMLWYALKTDKVIATDLETTYFDEENEEDVVVRLSQWMMNGDVFIVDHFKTVPFVDFLSDITAAEHCNNLYCFNNLFENKWFNSGDIDVLVRDVQNLRKAIMGGAEARLSLQRLIQMDFGYRTDKSMQVSSWKGELTRAQIEYAAEDVILVYFAAMYWLEEANQGHLRAADMLDVCWEGVSEMNETGFILNVENHEKVVEMWERRVEVSYKYMRKLTPFSLLPNLQSKIQVGNFLKKILTPAQLEAWPRTGKSGQLQINREQMLATAYVFSQSGADYKIGRWFAAYAVWERATHYLKLYGRKLINTFQRKGGIFPVFNIGAAITLRMSSSGDMNGQNLMRRPLVRRSFICLPGELLNLADYSGIEVRVLALLSGDEQLLHDCIYGNVHAESAIVILELDRDDFFIKLEAGDPTAKETRGGAKGFTFQLTYGAGSFALGRTMGKGAAEGREFVAKWAGRYPKAYAYRQGIYNKMMRTNKIEVETTGRTIYIPPWKRSIPVAANYPVQGAAAEVMYRAIYHVKRLYSKYRIPSRLMGAIHDELLSRTRARYAQDADELMVQGMQQGWLDIFPGTSLDNLIEHKIGTSWADKP